MIFSKIIKRLLNLKIFNSFKISIMQISKQVSAFGTKLLLFLVWLFTKCPLYKFSIKPIVHNNYAL